MTRTWQAIPTSMNLSTTEECWGEACARTIESRKIAQRFDLA